MNALAVKMQSDTATKAEIVDLEFLYQVKAKVAGSNNVTAPGIDPSKVKIVGAALNASPNSSVSFNVSKTDDSAKKAINTNLYKNVLQFDMDLSNASKVSSDGKLAAPTEIAMKLSVQTQLNSPVRRTRILRR